MAVALHACFVTGSPLCEGATVWKSGAEVKNKILFTGRCWKV